MSRRRQLTTIPRTQRFAPDRSTGRLGAADAKEIVIHRDDSQANDIHLHVPRAGFEMKAA